MEVRGRIELDWSWIGIGLALELELERKFQLLRIECNSIGMDEGAYEGGLCRIL